MPDIELDEGETELQSEVGSRGDAFREATRDRVAEAVRTSRRQTDVIDSEGNVLDAETPDVATLTEPPLEPVKPAQ
jgi:hypothetical protein